MKPLQTIVKVCTNLIIPQVNQIIVNSSNKLASDKFAEFTASSLGQGWGKSRKKRPLSFLVYSFILSPTFPQKLLDLQG